MTTRVPPGPPRVSKNPIALTRYLMSLRRDIVGLVSQRFRQYGDIYYAPVGGTELYVTRNPEHIREVLQTKGAVFEKPVKGNAARQLRRFLGDGLLNSNGDLWRRQRRMINPAFHKQKIESYAETMVAHTQEMLETWHDGQQLDLSRAMMELTLRIVSKALFDHDVRGDTDAVGTAMNMFRQMVGTPAFLPLWLPLPPLVRARKALEEVDRLVYGLIDERLSQPEKTKERSDLLSLLVQAVDEEDAGAKMTRKQLRDEILTLFLAGHETTSHALTWTMYLISQYPEVEERLVKEIGDVLGDRPVGVSDLGSLPYALMCLKESMRIFPPAYVISRTAKEATTVGGYPIPAGAEVLVWIYMTHHDERIYPEPTVFRPERFSEEAEAALPKCAYLPFGAGTRSCIGKSFAMLEAHLVLVSILQRFRLRHAKGHRVVRDFKVTLSPRHGMLMDLQARPSLEPAHHAEVA